MAEFSAKQADPSTQLSNSSELPEELIQEVVCRISDPHDIARLSCVSRSWRHSASYLRLLEFRMDDAVWGKESSGSLQRAQLMSNAIRSLVSRALQLEELQIDASKRDCLFNAADICQWIRLCSSSVTKLRFVLHRPNRWFNLDRPGAAEDPIPLFAMVLDAISGTSIKNLVINNCGWLTTRPFAASQVEAPSLESLTMTGLLLTVNSADGLDRLLLDVAPKTLHLGFVPLAPWPISLAFPCPRNLQELHLQEESFDHKFGFPALRLRAISVVGPGLRVLTVRPMTCLSGFGVDGCIKLRALSVKCQHHRQMNGPTQPSFDLPSGCTCVDVACSNLHPTAASSHGGQTYWLLPASVFCCKVIPNALTPLES
jgi:hypothetical protein